ncbi:MAG: TetR family transcriptional regulator [Aeromicrobium sp.]|nr:TetR family transcriptional regulator [Aeromicrobium sp.]
MLKPGSSGCIRCVDVGSNLRRVKSAVTLVIHRGLGRLSDALAVMLVNSGKAIVDDCVRIPHLREHPNFEVELTRSTLAALGLR